MSKLIESHHLVLDSVLKQIFTAHYGPEWTIEQLKRAQITIASENALTGTRYSIWRGQQQLCSFLVWSDWSDITKVTVKARWL